MLRAIFTIRKNSAGTDSSESDYPRRIQIARTAMAERRTCRAPELLWTQNLVNAGRRVRERPANARGSASTQATCRSERNALTKALSGLSTAEQTELITASTLAVRGRVGQLDRG